MDNEWKELEIGNLPSDILVGDYELEFNISDNVWLPSRGDSIYTVIKNIRDDNMKYRYRKRQPKANEESQSEQIYNSLKEQMRPVVESFVTIRNVISELLDEINE